MSIDKCLAALQDFMENPEPGHPLESDIAEEFVNRRDDFNSNAMAFTDANCEGGRIETLTAPTITTAQLDVYLEDFKSKYTGDATVRAPLLASPSMPALMVLFSQKVEEMQLGLAEFRALVSHQLGRDPTDGCAPPLVVSPECHPPALMPILSEYALTFAPNDALVQGIRQLHQEI